MTKLWIWFYEATPQLRLLVIIIALLSTILLIMVLPSVWEFIVVVIDTAFCGGDVLTHTLTGLEICDVDLSGDLSEPDYIIGHGLW